MCFCTSSYLRRMHACMCVCKYVCMYIYVCMYVLIMYYVVHLVWQRTLAA